MVTECTWGLPHELLSTALPLLQAMPAEAYTEAYDNNMGRYMDQLAGVRDYGIICFLATMRPPGMAHLDRMLASGAVPADIHLDLSQWAVDTWLTGPLMKLPVVKALLDRASPQTVVGLMTKWNEQVGSLAMSGNLAARGATECQP